MKKLFVIAVLVISLAGTVWGQEQETITYSINGRTKTVKAVYAGVSETRIYISGQYSDSWMIIDKAYKLVGEDWGDWETVSESPFPWASNTDLEKLVSELVQNTYIENTIDGEKMLFVVIRNQNNLRYWWESRKYICFLQRSYYIVE
jgi:hypothetical protein